MDPVENVLLLAKYLTKEQVIALVVSASRHQSKSHMSFIIKDVQGVSVSILTVQGHLPSGNYAIEATLVKRTQYLFKKFLPDFKINVTAQTYHPYPANIVDRLWISSKMTEKRIGIKQIELDTGIDKQSIADWLSGKQSINQVVKAFFFCYLSK